jgi:hypothetical protein
LLLFPAMRHVLATAVLVCVSSTAAAEGTVISGSALTLDPSRSPDSGQLGTWMAYAKDEWFAGGEIAIGSPQINGAEFAIAYHALAGVRGHLSPSITVAADGGLGVSQQTDWQWDLFGDGDMEMSTRAWTPSAAVRAHLAADLFTVRSSTFGLELVTDARSTLDSSAALEVGVGFGFYVAR